MKSPILIAALLLSFGAQAADYCTELAMDAEQIMSARQNGGSIERVNQAFSIKYSGDQLFVARAIIKDAYNTPIFSTNENKLKVVRALGSRWYEKCQRFQAGY
ncbi:hypothetical protein LUW10_01465 [Pseudomonas veronii]|uniref:hypothetical protein n=1 Tax=Pseudomonas veronii TaxID=76761 RepID=UPI001E39046B|nr:hypothetical protein [Pseudomonas veronii]UHH30533.1 hypothetical protein LUW10_01465 [Pseudomonas veronii]